MGRYDILLHPPDEPTRATSGQRGAKSVELPQAASVAPAQPVPKLPPRDNRQTSVPQSAGVLRSDLSLATEQAPPAMVQARSNPRSLSVERALAPSTSMLSASPSSPLSQDRDVIGPARKADQKYTLLFTTEELEALEDVKLELRRRFDVRTTKIELVRISVWDLLDDYHVHGEQSRLYKRLKHLRAQPTTQQNTSPTSRP